MIKKDFEFDICYEDFAFFASYILNYMILEILSAYENSKNILLLDDFNRDIEKYLSHDFDNIYEKI